MEAKNEFEMKWKKKCCLSLLFMRNLSSFSAFNLLTNRIIYLQPLSQRKFSANSRNKAKSVTLSSSNLEEPFPTRTFLNDPISPWKIDHQTPLSFIGSCFSSNIYNKLSILRFPYLHLNPFGIVFNPISIGKCLQTLLNEEIYESKNLFVDGNKDHPIYHSYDHHSEFDSFNREEILQKINQRIQEGSQQLLRRRRRRRGENNNNDNIRRRKDNIDEEDFSVLFLTFGTAKVYLLKEDSISFASSSSLPLSKVVANCHKRMSLKYFKILFLSF